jgi:hypothetical protein
MVVSLYIFNFKKKRNNYMTGEEKKHVLRFFKKLAILAFLLFLIDRGVGAFIRYAYEKYPTPDTKAFEHLIKTPSEDMYIFGSSRVVHGYVSNIFADTIGLSCFNAGREQTNVLYTDVIANAILRKHTPKLVIFDLNAKESVSHTTENSKLILASLMMPYVDSDTSFQRIAKDLFPKEMLIAKASVLQEFNSQVLPLILNLHKKNENRVTQNGYIPVHGSNVTGVLPKITDIPEIYDSVSKNYFEDFIKAVTSRNIKLYVVQSPYYVQKFTTSPSLQQFIPILKKYNVPFLDYSFDTAFTKQEYFYDNVHLNDIGAHVFSERLASDIKKDLEKNDPSVLKN